MHAVIVAVAVIAGFVALKPFGARDAPIPIPPAAYGQSESAPRPVKTNVVAYDTQDERMNAAKARARDTLPRFFELMRAKTQATHAVKFPLTQNGKTEHIWLQVGAYGDGVFSGRLSNEPINGGRYKIGDRLTVPQAQVEDWGVTDGDVIYGNYTSRVILADVPDERARLLAKRFQD